VIWKWLTVIGLAATPALILGQTAAWAAGFAFDLPTWPLGIAIALAGFLEGLLVVWLAALAHGIPWLHRWLSKLHAPRFDRWFKRWGVWTGVLVGIAAVGQEPVIVALVWLGAPRKKLVVPLAVANVLYTVIYYFVVRAGVAGWDYMLQQMSG
jgi:hypothetical protein